MTRPGQFQKGNRAAEGIQPRNPLTQRLISSLNEMAPQVAKAQAKLLGKGKKATREDITVVQAQMTKLAKIIDKMIEMAMDGDVGMIKEIFDRVEGRAKQGIELSGSVSTNQPTQLPSDLKNLSQSELVQLYRERVGLPVGTIAAVAATAPGSSANN